MPLDFSQMERRYAALSHKRKVMPKVRTGCLTCRKRRIKCDEAKPECRRCKSARKQCHGLGYSSKAISNSEIAIPSSRSHSDYNVPTNLIMSLIASKPESLSTPSNSLNCTDQDHRYFLLFQKYSAGDLTGYFQSDFWNRFVLQESHFHGAIKNGIIAIGALYKMVDVSQARIQNQNVKAEALRHFEFAIQQYLLAVRIQRRALENANSPDEIKSALVSCLLFICFEIFQGDWSAAEKQMVSGIRLLRQLDSVSDDGSGDIKTKRNGGNESDPMEAELCQIFSRLEVQLRVYDDVRPGKYVIPRLKAAPTPATPKISQIPLKFSSLEQARRAWDLSAPQGFDIHHRASSYQYSQPHDVPDEIKMQVKYSMMQLNAWNEAFEPIFRHSWTEKGEQYRLGASILKIDWLSTYILMTNTLELLETAYDPLLPEFEEIFSLATYICRQERLSLLGKTTFVFDATVMIPMILVVFKCRNRSLRRATLELLENCNRREGIWDSRLVAKIAGWIAAVEEEGLGPDDFIPESKRVRFRNATFNLQKRTAWVQCVQHLAGTNDFTNVKEANLTWQ